MPDIPKPIRRRGWLVVGLLPLAWGASAGAQLNETCVVTVGGQVIQVNPDGSFSIANIAAPDLFGPGGPGTRPDFLSDDPVRLTGTCTSGDITIYVVSECFRITQGEGFVVGNLTLSLTPPLTIEAIRAEPLVPTLTKPGQTTDVVVTATLSDGSTAPIGPGEACITYRTSNPAIVSVDGGGVVTANGNGTALITATALGSAAVTSIAVSLGDPLTTVEGFVHFEDGTPAVGADVTIADLAGTAVADSDGRFSIGDVPTELGPTTVLAQTTSMGETLVGAALALTAVPDGLTDAGIITLSDEIHWTASADGSWNDPANWDMRVVPLPGHKVFIDREGTYTVTLSSDVAVDSLTLGAETGQQTLTLGAGTLILDNVVVTSTATLHLISGTVELTTSSGVFTNDGRVLCHGSSAFDGPGSFSNSATGTIRVESGLPLGTARLTVANGFTNEGTIELATTDPRWAAELNVTSGTLVNIGTLDIQPTGEGRVYAIRAELDNRGTMNVAHGTEVKTIAGVNHLNSGTINITGGNLVLTLIGDTFRNTGSIEIGATRTLQILVGTLNQDAGSIAGPGTLLLKNTATANFTTDFSNAETTLSLDNSTFNGPGTLTNATSLIVESGTINAPFVNDGLFVARGNSTIGSDAGSFSNSASGRIRVESALPVGTARLTVANGFTNEGTIELTTTESHWASELTVTSGPLVNIGTLDIQPTGEGSVYAIRAELDNRGTMNVAHSVGVNTIAGVNHLNSGTINITGGNLLLSLLFDTFRNTGSIEIGATRTLTIRRGTLNQDAGAIAGPGTLSLDIATANFTTDFSNAETNLSLDNSTFNGPGTLTNATSLIVESSTINAPFVNDGLFVAHGNSTIGSDAGSFSNSASGRIRVESGDGLGHATLTVANGFANQGTIELTSSASSNVGATLVVTDGTLVNAGAIEALEGSGFGSRTITAQIDNQGTLNALFGLTINKASATHISSGDISVTGGNLTVLQAGTSPSFTSSGSISIGSGRTFAVSGGTFVNVAGGVIQGVGTLNVAGTTFVQDGAVNPGESAGLLSVTGNFPEGPTAVVNIELGGLIPGDEFDVLAITNAATFDGTLEISLINDFAPQLGDTFVISTYTSHTGTFSKVNAPPFRGGLFFQLTYGTNGLTLTVDGS